MKNQYIFPVKPVIIGNRKVFRLLTKDIVHRYPIPTYNVEV